MRFTTDHTCHLSAVIDHVGLLAPSLTHPPHQRCRHLRKRQSCADLLHWLVSTTKTARTSTWPSNFEAFCCASQIALLFSKLLFSKPPASDAQAAEEQNLSKNRNNLSKNRNNLSKNSEASEHQWNEKLSEAR
ncbi:unnamed protein product [Effrenium voratum]|nr:unnamed protein product [Effrenium voratum]